jgi:hypothetical protein
VIDIVIIAKKRAFIHYLRAVQALARAVLLYSDGSGVKFHYLKRMESG